MNRKKNRNIRHCETRRSFLRKAATAAAVLSTANIFRTPVFGQNQAPSPGSVLGANERIVVGFIGVGLMGGLG